MLTNAFQLRLGEQQARRVAGVGEGRKRRVRVRFKDVRVVGPLVPVPVDRFA